MGKHLTVIEAAYSFIINEPIGVCGSRRRKEIRRARIYCTTGYYNEKIIGNLTKL